MTKTYEIKQDGSKYNAYYYHDSVFIAREFHSLDGVDNPEKVRPGYVNINRVKWAEMMRDLLTPGGSIITRMRATAKTTISMSVEFSTVMAVLQNGVNGFPDEPTLQTLLRLSWGFTASEKTTLNTYFSNNNFSITVT